MILHSKVFFLWLCGSQAEAQNKESGKTVLYLLIIFIILISYIIIHNTSSL